MAERIGAGHWLAVFVGLAVGSSFFKQSFPPINSRISQVNAFDSEELRCVSFNVPCKHICPQCTSRTESGVLLDVAECAKRPPSALVPMQFARGPQISSKHSAVL